MKNQTTIVEAFSEMAPDYERKVSNELKRFWGLSYSDFIDEFLAKSPVGTEDRILDIATGTSVIPLKLVERGKTAGKIIGLDITPAMLLGGQKKIEQRGATGLIRLTCGSALCMPFSDGGFQTVLCGLATHHMDVDLLLSEIYRVLAPDGRLSIADVGGSPVWHFPVISQFIRAATFLYFVRTEGVARARAESSALSNVRTPEQWRIALQHNGFSSIQVTQSSTRQAWYPSPLFLTAIKSRPYKEEHCPPQPN